MVPTPTAPTGHLIRLVGSACGRSYIVCSPAGSNERAFEGSKGHGLHWTTRTLLLLLLTVVGESH